MVKYSPVNPSLDVLLLLRQVVDRLFTADLLCLKRTIAVSKEKTVECIAVRHDGDAIELWMGSGVSSHHGGQVSWINLTDTSNKVCCLLSLPVNPSCFAAVLKMSQTTLLFEYDRITIPRKIQVSMQANKTSSYVVAF